MKRRGERDVPCGTPRLINSPELQVPLNLVYYKRSDKQNLRIFKAELLIPKLRSFDSKIS